MALILIDYENVNEYAFTGIEFLNDSDEIVFFYSKQCKTVATRILYSIIDSECKIGTIKLLATRPNALDFYITSVIGERFGSGYNGDIIIVSNDRGFESVHDYWKNYGNKSIILAHNIAIGLSHTTDDYGRERRRKISSFMEQSNLGTDIRYLLYFRQLKEFVSVNSIGISTANIKRLSEIGFSDSTPKYKYLKCIKAFGMKKGCKLYSIIKQCQTIS